MRTTFFTCCNSKYEDFIPIFIHSILYHNNNADVEIGVERIPDINVLSIINLIEKKFPHSKIKIRIVSFRKYILGEKSYGVCPNVIRFIETPEIINEYVYISDIDIITLQTNISDIHIKNMIKNNINYSNIVRPYTNPNEKRLTGLHFTKWKSYYPIPNFDDLVTNGNLNLDEVFLYNLVSKRNTINEGLTFRPVHGIHVSPNRPNPEGIIEWGVELWINEWKSYRQDIFFKEIETKFSNRLIESIKKIDNICQKNS